MTVHLANVLSHHHHFNKTNRSRPRNRDELPASTAPPTSFMPMLPGRAPLSPPSPSSFSLKHHHRSLSMSPHRMSLPILCCLFLSFHLLKTHPFLLPRSYCYGHFTSPTPSMSPRGIFNKTHPSLHNTYPSLQVRYLMGLYFTHPVHVASQSF